MIHQIWMFMCSSLWNCKRYIEWVIIHNENLSWLYVTLSRSRSLPMIEWKALCMYISPFWKQYFEQLNNTHENAWWLPVTLEIGQGHWWMILPTFLMRFSRLHILRDILIGWSVINHKLTSKRPHVTLIRAVIVAKCHGEHFDMVSNCAKQDVYPTSGKLIRVLQLFCRLYWLSFVAINSGKHLRIKKIAIIWYVVLIL